MKLKIRTLGWEKPLLNQIDRIDQGLISLGHQLVLDGYCDLIYSHDFSQIENAIKYHEFCKSQGWDTKLLCKVLDLDINHKIDFSWEKKNLLKADAILANSLFVQKQIKELLKLESIVIDEAIKELTDINISFCNRNISFLSIGRLNDLNKRSFLAKELYELFKGERVLVGCGPEPFGFVGENIKHFGIVDDNGLSTLANNSKFCLCFGKLEGNYLPPKELCMVTIPILLSDMTTIDEWDLKELICEPNAISIKNKILEIEQNYNYYLSKCKNYYKQIIWPKYNKNQIAKNIISAYQTLI